MSRHRPLLYVIGLTGTVAAAVAASQWASMLLWMPEPRSHMVWFPGAVLLAALLMQPLRRWPLCVLGAAVGEATAFGVLGVPMLPVMWTMLGTLVLTPLAAAALGCLRSRSRSPLEDFRLLTVFILLGGLALPVLSAAWIAWAVSGSVLEQYLSDWANVALAQSLGTLMLVPALVWGVLLKRSQVLLQVTGRTCLIGLALLIMLCVLWMAKLPFDRVQPMLMVAPVPFVFWALVSFRALGASLAMLAVGLLAMHFSAAGVGPFLRGDLTNTTVAVQLWTVSLTVGLLYMSVVVEQRATRTQALQEAHGHLQTMTTRLIRAQEDERSRIARDLHDGVNQSIASLVIKVSLAKRRGSDDERELLNQLQQQLNEISEDVRRLSHELHPSVLRYTGLATALKGLCKSQQGLHVVAKLSELDDLSLEQATALYRIAQEALRNVDKHAQARRIVVRLARVAGNAVLEIRDDGVGCQLQGGSMTGGLGMVSMRERARGVGGELQVQPVKDGGTRVMARVPLHPGAATESSAPESGVFSRRRGATATTATSPSAVPTQLQRSPPPSP